MRRAFFPAIVLALILCGLSPHDSFAAAAAPTGGWTGNINGFLGLKFLDDDDWAPVEDQGELGVEIDFRPRSWPINLAVDLLFSAAEEENFLGTNVEGSTWEIDVGVRKIWENLGRVRPFIGGGLAFASGEFEAFGISDDDTGVGFWVDGGLVIAATPSFNVGFELRFSKADVTIFGVDADAGGTHLGVLLGYHW